MLDKDQLLVTNPFADDSADNNGTLDTLHPLRTQRCDTSSIPSVALLGSEGETRPRLTRLLSLDGLPADEASEEIASNSEPPQDSSDIIIHYVRPNDSFAGVALRYGVSIAALRRANQLWPSDPIHLRTELLIPHGDAFFPRHKSTRKASTDTTLGTTVGPTPGSSPDLVASSFVAARQMILSVLPARISLDSLSSRTSMSEDHELDNLHSARALPTAEPPFTEEGHELAILTTPRPRYKPPVVPLSSQILCPSNNSQHMDINHGSPVPNLRSRSFSLSRTVSLERLPRMQPFAVLPVRTSQLEPEPAMELPARFAPFRDHDP